MKSFTLLLTLGILLCSVPVYEYNGAEMELVSLINSEREASGVPPLDICWEISRLASYKSEEMKQYRLFNHESIVYGNPAQALDFFSIPNTEVGANIAMGQETPQSVVTAWANSPEHLANLLNPAFTRAGVGLSWDEYGIPFWTLLMIDS